jgi:hypothetical protein
MKMEEVDASFAILGLERNAEKERKIPSKVKKLNL